MSNNTIAMQRDAAENALRAVDFWLDELGCGYAVEGSTLKPSDVAEAVAQAVSTLRRKLAEERAAHLATRQELSMALAQLAHARVGVEVLGEALRAYGAHTPDCGDAHGCTCGYSAALGGQPRET